MKKCAAVKAFRKIRHYYSLLGISGTLAFLFAKLSGTQPLFKANFGIKHPFYLRIGTTDASVCKQVFIERHYDFLLPLTPKVIIDAGANIGASAVFFANKYVDSTIFALEPEESNFTLLQRNVSAYLQIKPLKIALWGDNRKIDLVDPGSGHHGFQTVEKTSNIRQRRDLVRAMTLDTLMIEESLDYIDILKIDIEGAEKEVFETSSAWIDKVKVIMVELHHDKDGAVEAFSKATGGFDKPLSKGETLMLLRNTTAMQKGL